MTRTHAIRKGRELAAAKRRIAELEEVVERHIALMDDAHTKLNEAAETIKELQENAEFWTKQYRSEKAAKEAAKAEYEDMCDERDRFRTQAEADRENLRKFEAERMRERGYIEGLLDGQHPQRPALPWEPNILREERVGNISVTERAHRRGMYGG